MQTNWTTKRIWIFLAFAFGIAWATALVIYLTGGLQNSPLIVPNLPLAIVLMATTYMCAPAVANIATRLITREGWSNTWLRPNFKRGWRMYLAAWLLPLFLTILGGVIFYLLFPQYFDPTLGAVRTMLQKAPPGTAISPWMVVIINTIAGLIAGLTINAVFAFGEEFGWRAYLLPKLMERFAGSENASSEAGRAAARKASLLIGLIWGVWHWPVIFMGYEYGLNYPGAPVLGPLVFLVFTTTLSIFLTWVTLRSGSVLPAAIGHGTVNGTPAIAAYFITGTPNLLLGPLPMGLIGGLGYVLIAVLLFAHPKALSTREPTTPVEAAATVMA